MYKSIKYYFRTLLGRNIYCLRLIAFFIPKHKDKIVREDTLIVIEGFPRSANTYVYSYFRLLTKNEKIASHQHATSQFTYAVNHNIPVLIVIRNPIDAISSMMIREPAISPLLFIQEYINFYKTVLINIDGIVIVNFEEIDVGFLSVLETLNDKFGFPYTEDLSITKEMIFKYVEALEQQDSGGVVRATHVAKPNESRKLIKKSALKTLEEEKYKDVLYQAVSLYKLISQYER